LGLMTLRHGRFRVQANRPLINDTLFSRPFATFAQSCVGGPGAHFDRIEGLDYIDRVIEIDQRPRSGAHAAFQPRPRIPGLFRAESAKSSPPCPRAARARGYEAGRFSFQCEGRTLRGMPGRMASSRSKCISSLTSMCPAMCAKANATNRETLEIRFQGKEYPGNPST